MGSPLTQTIQIALELSSDNDELRAMVATLTAERDEARSQLRIERALYGEACTDIVQTRQELAAERAAHAATCEAWKRDKDFRAATATTNGTPRAPSIPRQVVPPVEEMEA